MPKVVNDFRDRWERMNPRERKLLVALGGTFVVCIFLWLVFAARDGMAALEAKNDLSRKALRSLAQHRAGAAQRAASANQVSIPKKAISLDSYLEDIVNELSLDSPTYPAPKSDVRGAYEELSFKVEFKGLDITTVSQLLEKIETKSRAVVVKELTIDRNFRDKEKLDVELVVATYVKRDGEGAGADDEDDGEEG